MKKLLSLLVSLVILSIIYTRIPMAQLLSVFQSSNPFWMVISLGMFIPLTLLTSWRLLWLAPTSADLGLAESTRLTLQASVLNMVLPSKMGDIIKAVFMADRGHISRSLALSIVVFEKACDMLSLLVWCLGALLLYPNKGQGLGWLTLMIALMFFLGVFLLASRGFAKSFFALASQLAPGKIGAKLGSLKASWAEMQAYFWGNRARLFKVSLLSILIWLMHLLQIWLFVLALNAWVPFSANLALAPLAILAGLLPLTFAGVGTRDAAIISLYSAYLAPSAAAALGLLCTSRYLLPALAGLPFIRLEQLSFTRSPHLPIEANLSHPN